MSAVIPTSLPGRHEQQPQRQPKQKVVPGSRRLRVNWARTATAVVVLYLGGLMLYGEVVDVRMAQRTHSLQRQLSAVQAENRSLAHEARTLLNPSGASLAARSELGVVPKGQIPVVLVQNQHGSTP